MPRRESTFVLAHRAAVGVSVGLALAMALAAGCGRQEPPAESKAATTAGGKPVSPPDGKAEALPNEKQDQEANSVASTALCQACLEGNLDAARAALESGADVDARGENGGTALMLAAYDGHEEVVRLLLENGADVNAIDPAGRTALMYCASGPFPRTLQLLLVKGAEVNVRDRAEMFTALMFAASEGQVENVRLLLSRGADPTLVDVDGDTAASFARKNDHSEVAELLE